MQHLIHFALRSRLLMVVLGGLVLGFGYFSYRQLPVDAFPDVTPALVQVFTETEEVKASREAVMEYLLINHPVDCPICDKAGECTLQDYSFQEAQAEGRTSEPRRTLEKRKDLGDVILLDQERCILCSRCVRFMDEIPKSPQLCISGRGSDSVVETWQDAPLTGNYQGTPPEPWFGVADFQLIEHGFRGGSC